MPTVPNENAMATNMVATGADEPDDDGGESNLPVPSPGSPGNKPGSSSRSSAGQSFFTIYKKGQGKWTRLGTVFIAGLLGILTSYNLYGYVQVYGLPASMANDSHVKQILLAICVGFLVAFGVFVFYLTNQPRNADFLIATDSEMKKVNWTTKGELLGSTRVVVLFLFFIAIFLSVVDLIFYYFFHFIRVLQ